MTRKTVLSLAFLLSAAPALGQDALCNAVLAVAKQEVATYSYEDVATSLIDDMCSQDFQSSGEMESHYAGGSVGFAGATIGGGGGGGQQSFEERYQSLCATNQESSSRLAKLNRVASFPNEKAIQAWLACMRESNVPDNVVAVITPQGNNGRDFTIDLKLIPHLAKKLKILNITPSKFKCSYSQKAAIGADYPTFSPSLDCVRDDPNELLQVRVATNIANTLRMPIQPYVEGSSIVTIAPNLFHDPKAGSNSTVVISEIRILDENDNQLPISAIQPIGCSDANCMGNAASLIDDQTGDSGFWATYSDGSHSLAELKIVLQNPSKVSSVGILQQLSFGCMRNCSSTPFGAIRRDISGAHVFLNEEGRGKQFSFSKSPSDWVYGEFD